MARPKKNSTTNTFQVKPEDVDNIDQTHGSLSVSSPRTVEELLGLGKIYSVESLAEYQNQLNSMTDIDLHQHAVSAGVVPGVNNSRITLIDRLERQFLTNQSRNVFKNVPMRMSAEAQKRQERIMQGSPLI